MNIYASITDPEVVRRLQSGELGIVPVDTVYGVVGLASKSEIAARLYEAKQREGKPGTVIAADIEQLLSLGLKRRYLTPVAQYWPGAVSVVVPCGQELEYLHLGKQSLAVRIPDNAQLLDVLRSTGPLITSSANLTGQQPSANLAEAQGYFGDTVDFYVNGGDLSDRLPSTIIRIVDDEIEVLRQGAVTIK